MTTEVEAAIRERHHSGAIINRIGPGFGKPQCDYCLRVWPCDTAIGLAVERLPRGFVAVLVDASEGYSATLEWQDDHYVRHTTSGTGPTLVAAINNALGDTP